MVPIKSLDALLLSESCFRLFGTLVCVLRFVLPVASTNMPYKFFALAIVSYVRVFPRS